MLIGKRAMARRIGKNSFAQSKGIEPWEGLEVCRELREAESLDRER